MNKKTREEIRAGESWLLVLVVVLGCVACASIGAGFF